MSFPQRFIDELHSRLLLSEEVGKKIKLTKKGTQYWGCCPFHQEKTPSFSVSDMKGFYYCFGCGAHGDIIDFLMQTEGLSFSETIKRLAEKAGLEVPVFSSADKYETAFNSSLYNVLEYACLLYQENLYTKSGSKALSYLRGRGLSDNIIKEFRIGFSGTGTLKKFLSAKEISEEQMIASGLYTNRRENGLIYEYFQNRIMFPILDRKERVVAFGGRVMDHSEPKYLNSPETELFHKSNLLFSYQRAVSSARKKNSIILSEGYMDVIALNSHGYTNSVAPLGTALGEYQIELLWKAVNEPLICFDGDTAGVKAAKRAAMKIIPMLKEGYSFNFVFLPDNMDPDEILRLKGKDFFDNLLNHPIPLSEFLWQCLTEGKTFSTPERIAALEKEIKSILKQINSNSVRNYYSDFLKSKIWTLNYQVKKNFSKSKKSQNITVPKIKEGENEAKKIISYMIYYPEIMAKWLEKITFTKLSPILKNTAELVTTMILENPDITKDELLAAIPENIHKYFEPEFEILNKNFKLPQQIEEQLQEHFLMLELQNVEREIKEVASELTPYLNEPPPELWERYCALVKQKQKIKEELLD